MSGVDRMRCRNISGTEEMMLQSWCLHSWEAPTPTGFALQQRIARAQRRDPNTTMAVWFTCPSTDGREDHDILPPSSSPSNSA